MLRWVSAGTWNTTTLVQGTRIFRFVPRFESHISMVSLEYKIIRRFMTSFLILILIARMLFLERGKWKPRLTFSGFQERLEIFSICLQILRMSLSMFHGGAEACGVVAGGGTEVTLLACLGIFFCFPPNCVSLYHMREIFSKSTTFLISLHLFLLFTSFWKCLRYHLTL